MPAPVASFGAVVLHAAAVLCGRLRFHGGSGSMAHPYWLLFDLDVRTTRLTLRYVDEALAVELAELHGGIHDPGDDAVQRSWFWAATCPSRLRATWWLEVVWLDGVGGPARMQVRGDG